MNPLGPLRRASWLSGALLLLLAVGLVTPAAWVLGLRRWPFYVGLLALVLLLQGALERRWPPRPGPPHPRKRHRFLLLPGGKGNGKSYDLADDDTTDKQRWLM